MAEKGLVKSQPTVQIYLSTGLQNQINFKDNLSFFTTNSLLNFKDNLSFSFYESHFNCYIYLGHYMY